MLKFALKTAVAGSICAGLVVLGMKVAPLVVTEDGGLDFGNLRFEDLIESYNLSAPGEAGAQEEVDEDEIPEVAEGAESGITGEVSFSTTEPTRENVTATVENLSNPEAYVKGGESYVFEGNEMHVFELCVRDEGDGEVCNNMEVTVDWIDKVAPEGGIAYDPEGDMPTNEDVKVTLTIKNSEEVTLLAESENGEWVDSGSGNVFEHVFTENGEYVFKFRDAAGNVGEATAKVDWIDKVAPTATVIYDRTELELGHVTATVVKAHEEDEDFTVVNNNGLSEYVFTKGDEDNEFTFEIRDAAGNSAYVVATVSWVDPTPDDNLGDDDGGDDEPGDDDEETPGTGDGDDDADDSGDVVIGGGMGANDPEDDLGEWEGQVDWGGGAQNDGSGESQIENNTNAGGATVNNNQSQGWQNTGMNTGNWAQVAENGNGNDEALNEDDKSGVDDELSFEMVSGEVMMDEEVAKDKNSKKDEGASSTEVKEWYEDPFVIYGGAGLVAFVGVMIGVGAWVNRKK